MKRKNYATAILLNLFLPGAGYIYAGRVFIGVVVLLLFAGAVYGGLSGIEALQGAAGLLSLVGAVDGYLTVRKHNDRYDAQNQAACPHCAEKIQKNAKICKHCQHQVAAA